MAANKTQRTLADRMRQAISTHPRINLMPITFLIGAGVVAMATLGLILAALVKGDSGFLFGALVFSLIPLLGAALFGGIGLKVLYTTPSEVRLYPFGVKWRLRGQELECDWDEVAEVYRSEVITVTRHGRSRDGHVTLVFDDGTKLICTNRLKNYDKLASRLMSETANTLIVRLRKQLDDGVDFGPIELDRKGVTIEDDFYPYDELRQTRVRNGQLIFYFPRKQKYEFPLGTVPNYLVLFGLLDELGKPGIVDQRPDPD